MHWLPLVTLFFIFYQQSLATECKHRIIFLPQTHARDIKLFGEADINDDRDKVITSQFSIAKYIETNSKTPVFSEGASATKTLIWDKLTTEQKKKARDFSKSVFSNGLPETLHDLSENQKSVLYKADAASLALAMEKIPAIYRVINPEDYEIVFEPIKKWIKTNPGKPWTPEIRKLVRDKRERFALAEIRKFFDEHPEQRDVTLVFGSNHNFSIYPDLFDPTCVVVPYQFQSIWHGKSRGGYESANNYIDQSIK